MTEEKTILLKPGTLWPRVIEKTEQALACGALLSLPTEHTFVEQGGVHFLVRTLANLNLKRAAKKAAKASGKKINPFLPYEEELFVTDISKTHVCLLNKYNVANYHLLIITRDFEEQENLLTLQDFEALWACMAEFEGLAFYNAGKKAGASQRHKHLQLVPLPLAPTSTPESSQIPIASLFSKAIFQGPVGKIPGLPFSHAFAQLDSTLAEFPSKAALTTFEQYQTLLHTVGLGAQTGETKQSGAYNLLLTRQWMLLVPRSQEDFESISVNSLGFAGALLVRNEPEMELLKNYGPMNVLKSVALPRVDEEYLKAISATLSEWDSADDEQAYREL
jgi:sulfate adenylyltransferase (ADP) / ATP adenylyltransferase